MHIERLDGLLRTGPSAWRRLTWRFAEFSRTMAVGPSDFALGGVGLALGSLVFVLMCLQVRQQGEPFLSPTAWFVALRILATVWPIHITRSRYPSEVSLDAPLLGYWLLMDGPSVAVLYWIIGSLLAELLFTHVLAIGATNLGIAALAATAAATAFRGLQGIDPWHNGLLPCIAAGVVYLLVDHLTTLGCLAVMGETKSARNLMPRSLQQSLAVTAILMMPGWAITQMRSNVMSSVVLAATMALVILLTATMNAMRDQQRRLGLIVSFLHRMPSFPDEDAAFRGLEACARELLGTQDVVVRGWAPSESRRETGYSLDDPGPGSRRRPGRDSGYWVVARIRDLDANFHPSELQALETLAAVAGESIANRRSTDQTAWLATHDVLTRLANRAHLLDRMLAAERNPEARAGHDSAVVLIDIDGFKGVNDHIGHDAGDHVLAVLGPRIGEGVYDTIGERAIASRLGGDEFALFLPSVSSAASVQRACEVVRERIKEPIDWQGRKLRLDASIGFSMGPQILATSLLREADAAMYQVKHSGKGGIARYMLATSLPG